MRFRLSRRTFLLAGAAVVAEPALGVNSRAPSVALAKEGRALLPVVVPGAASARMRQAASTLATYLERISGARFELTTDSGEAGISLGLAVDVRRHLTDGLALAGSDPTTREDYVLRTHSAGLLLAGSTELAVEHAVWDLLHRIGYRQFFPGETWEIVPRIRDLSVSLDALERPAYFARRIWYGYGQWGYNEQPYADWCAKNRATSGITLRSGHAYRQILRKNKRAFEAHPEYLALINGERKGDKFCISNPGLRRLVVDDVLRRLAKKPEVDSISVEPSDGGGWCECDPCAELGTISDRAVLLANEVAAAVNQHYPGKFVGMYAYNHHSEPPNIEVHPQVIISVATAFISGNRSVEEVISGWSKKCRMFGIREYYSVNPWDRDQPAAARAGSIDYLRRTIPAFHRGGARFMSAESSDNWGPNGVGYYLAARALWDVSETEGYETLVEDFLTRAFGNAKEPMRAFYDQLDGSPIHRSTSSGTLNKVMRRIREALGLIDNQLAVMFRALADALALADDPAVQRRIADLVLYARYVDLYARYSRAEGSARQNAFEALIRHAYRMRTTMLVHTKALYRDLPGRDKSVRIPTEAGWKVDEESNPWKSSRPFGRDEISGFLREGLQRYAGATAVAVPVDYSDDLTSTEGMGLGAVEPGFLGPAVGAQTFYTRVDAAPSLIAFNVTSAPPAALAVVATLWKVDFASQPDEGAALVGSGEIAADGEEHLIELPVSENGLYRLRIEGGGPTTVTWNSKLPLTLRSAGDEPMNGTYDLWNLYFYVPHGTKVVSLYGGGHGEIRDSTGRILLFLNGREPGEYHIPVPAGEDGKLWSIRYGRGAVLLLSVPPYLARRVSELLLPSEVVAHPVPGP